MKKLSVLVGLLVSVAIAASAHALTCTIDSVLDLAVKDTKAIDYINQHKCLLDLLRTRAKGTPKEEVLCTSTTISASTRAAIQFVSSSTLTGAEIIDPTVSDSVSPAAIVPAGALTPSGGTTVTAYFFNHDGSAARVCRPCVKITRP